MLCVHCSKQLPNDAAFCHYCGKSVANVLTSALVPPPPISEEMVPPFTPAAQASDQPPVGTESRDMNQQPFVTAPNKPPQIAIPVKPNRIQRLLIYLFQPALAGNPWLGIGLGGACAALLEAIIFVLLLPLGHALLGANMPASSTEDILFGTFSLNNSVHEALQALLLAHGVGRHLISNVIGAGGTITLTTDITTPLQLTLILPAILLTFGGYVAASSDMENRLRFSLLRGAAIAIPYTVVLLLFATQAGGDLAWSPLGNAGSGGGGMSTTLSMDNGTLIFYGLLWGALFGLLGASLKQANGQWRGVLQNYLRTNSRLQLTSFVVGGLFAAGLGLLLMLVVEYSIQAGGVLTQFIPFNVACFSSTASNISAVNIIQAPFLAFQLLAFATGAPVTTSSHMFGSSQLTGASSNVACSASGQDSLSVLSGHFSPWVYLLILIPLISIFLGGRISVALARTRGNGPSALQGALVAIPFTIVMMILAGINTLRFSGAISGNAALLGNISGTSFEVAVGSGIIDVMLWSLLMSAILGALGGLYQISIFGRSIDALLVSVGFLLRAPLVPFMIIIDNVTGRSRTNPPGRTLTMVYIATVVAVILTALAIIVGNAFISFNQIITLEMNQRIHSILNILLVALPCSLLLWAGILALFDDLQDKATIGGKI